MIKVDKQNPIGKLHIFIIVNQDIEKMLIQNITDCIGLFMISTLPLTPEIETAK